MAASNPDLQRAIDFLKQSGHAIGATGVTHGGSFAVSVDGKPFGVEEVIAMAAAEWFGPGDRIEDSSTKRRATIQKVHTGTNGAWKWEVLFDHVDGEEDSKIYENRRELRKL